VTILETDLLAAIASGTGCGLVIIDEGGLVEYWSSQLEEVSGLAADQVVGQAWSGLVLPCGFAGAESGGLGFGGAATVLSGITFYPIAPSSSQTARRVGVLRLTSQYAAEGEGLPFAAENAVGIPSQRAMFELLQRQLAYQSRYKTPFSLLFLRMKNFRTFVEVLGVENWELTNRAVYDQLSAVVRMADSVGLYDGATFWMVLSNSDIDGTLVVADKVKRLASSMKVEAIDIFLSVAVGAVVACAGEKGEDLVKRCLIETEKAAKLSSGLSVES
jgi:diguanylate cyclase (GGDEF)-like protein